MKQSQKIDSNMNYSKGYLFLKKLKCIKMKFT